MGSVDVGNELPEYIINHIKELLKGRGNKVRKHLDEPLTDFQTRLSAKPLEVRGQMSRSVHASGDADER